jgi:hypothetical protein
VRRRVVAGLVAGCVLSVGCPWNARAQEEEGRPPQKPASWSITFAPIRLIHPIFELELERRITDVVSITAIGAGGKTDLDTLDQKVTTYEAGGQLSYYAVGDFDRGLMLSVEALYVKLDSMTQVGEQAGFGVGPLLGYKIALRSGLTFLAQAGISFYSGEGELANNVACERCVANLNLNVGYSF